MELRAESRWYEKDCREIARNSNDNSCVLSAPHAINYCELNNFFLKFYELNTLISPINSFLFFVRIQIRKFVGSNLGVRGVRSDFGWVIAGKEKIVEFFVTNLRIGTNVRIWYELKKSSTFYHTKMLKRKGMHWSKMCTIISDAVYHCCHITH